MDFWWLFLHDLKLVTVTLILGYIIFRKEN